MKDNSFWSTTQGKSTIKFVAWMIFIIILIVIFAINGKPENNNINNTQEKNAVAAHRLLSFIQVSLPRFMI